jgi:hypothetical protein
MGLRPFTADDAVRMASAAKSRQVGDFVQPTLIGHEVNGEFVPLSQRRTLRVTDRVEYPGRPPFGDMSVRYRGVDVHEREFEFWPSDDPRPASEAEWRAEEPL